MNNEFIEKLKQLVNRKEPRDYEDESPGEVHSGNYDDCYDAGVEDGERWMAKAVRDLLEKSNL